ncbi:hypothetical protein Z968_13135 [Clostridium novyi A str. 4552]|uniref:Iron ABC transporter substrate-binding protein n=1 Tax=Clostridium novyi A str. 4552 TaxID=1444289 RepID=A0A0A0HZL1_CLONO|nr:putative 2-aminoethylphosphonate ABC transporter substrate-binding protein [Clostridium novyi]KGM92770.1 hypothetical protein Z968_13135 [Clostridium novyi A str. 4552]
MKKVLLLIISIFVISTLWGCGKRNEQVVNVYTTTEDEYIDSYVQAFNKKYPNIKVNIVRDSTGVITSKILAEKDSPNADVIWDLAATSLVKLKKENMLEQYVTSSISNIDKRFMDKEQKPYWVGVSLWTNAFTVNVKEAKAKGIDIPKSYKDLLMQKYKKQISMPNPGTSGTGYMFVSAIIQNLGEKKGWEYLDQLNKNMRAYEHSGTGPIKSTAMGEQLIGIDMRGESLREEKKSPQIKTFFPQEGLAWDLDGIALVKKKEIKEESKKFIDWILSPEAMQIEAEKRNRVVTYKGISDKNIYPKNFFEVLMKNDIETSANNREKIVDEWNKRYK